MPDPTIATTATPTPNAETVVDQVIDLANTVIVELRQSGQLNGQATAALQANTAALTEVKAVLVEIKNAQILANTIAQEQHSWSKLVADTAKVICDNIRSGMSSHVATGFLGALGMFVIQWLYAHFDLSPPTNNEPPVIHEQPAPARDDAPAPVQPPR